MNYIFNLQEFVLNVRETHSISKAFKLNQFSWSHIISTSQILNEILISRHDLLKPPEELLLAKILTRFSSAEVE